MKQGPKENLTWKINYLAAQVGEKTHMKRAIVAAARAKHQQIHSSNAQYEDRESLRAKLQSTRKQKLEQKLHQARREIRSALKKSKLSETQKLNKKIKSIRLMLENKENEENEGTEDLAEESTEESTENSAKKPTKKSAEKKVTEQDLLKLEKELDILKHVDLGYLTEKKIKSTIQKNSALKNEEFVKELVDNIKIKNTYAENIDELLVSNVEARLLSNKAVIAESQSIIHSFKSTLKGDAEKIEKKRTEEQKKKRKAEEEMNEENTKKAKKPSKPEGSSKFMESLVADDEKNDENFKNIYEGVKKPNRVGQRQRRKQWEELYGRKANHIAAEFEKREEKRLANPDYKPKKVVKPVVKSAPAEPMHPSWEAKRQQQEMMSQALSGKGSSNNKIVFDD